MKTKSFRKVLLGLSGAALSCMMVLSGVLPIFSRGKEEAQASPLASDSIKDITGMTDLKLSDYFNSSVTQKMPESVSPDREISVMVAVDVPTILDGYEALGNTSMDVGDFAGSKEGKAIRNKIDRENGLMQAQLTRKGIDYKLGVSYDTIMSGFEVVIKAGDFEKLQKAVGNSAGVFISEEYAQAVTYEVVENEVNVHDTGIFNSDNSEFDGSGTVVAVLDSGLDYTHDVFNANRFDGEEVITQESLREKVSQLSAAQRTPGLTASDVYVSKKIPYAYDYADSDPDVYPINSDHGTHVSGIIVGQSDPALENDGIEDNYIRGVAPNAQLAFFKVFSEGATSAKESWIVAALEDCVTLGVDVINMSLGSVGGFSREVDDVNRARAYDAVKAQGINLVCAAGNDYSSAMGSDRNGNLPLSTNPDTGNVGAPSSYDASLSVASISGVKTPYMLLNDDIVYFTNARNFAGEEKKFIDEILPAGVNEQVFDYVIVPNLGSDGDYIGLDLQGKLAVVARGVTTFEEKAQIAADHGAVGCIIYNNVSGDIAMTIGATDLPTCSIDMDNGHKFIENSTTVGKVKISRGQVAGPFMSDFSDWGPTPDLGLKPEITAHGGDILSSIPGQKYERFSGTSMAAPNQSGVTALVRQYVKKNFPSLTPLEVTAMVNHLTMSTADIALNNSGIPFAVRKQGAGLANVTKATSTPAYMRTYDRDTGELFDKAKLELGDDPEKTGTYSFKFELVNISGSSVSYEVGAIVQTEGISEELTWRGDTTITEKGYVLNGATITVQSVEGASNSGNTVTVSGNSTAVIHATITLSDSDKEYMNSRFANGIFVEGFVKLTSKDSKNCNLNVPFLTYFGSWTQAPIFDRDYFETYADENNPSLLMEEKTLPDYYATRPIGAMYGDYIAYLGSFPYVTDPNSSLILGADRDKIALTNQEGEYGGLNGLKSIYFGLLRGAKYVDLTITDSTTGEVVWSKTKYNLMKSVYANGTHIGSEMALDFYVREQNLKNNTRYDVKAVAYLDYDDGGIQDNVKNVFEFPFYTDFEAPVATGCEFTYEYDYDTKTNRLFANVSIYDNQYLMGYIAGSIGINEDFDSSNPDSYLYTTDTFESYVTPVLGQRNVTNVIQIELTDQLERIKQSHDGRSFIVQCMDYAMNNATYEFTIPDEVTQISFPEMSDGNDGIRISPNETYRLNPTTVPSQDVVWRETINYTSSNENIAKVVNGQVLGVAPGEAIITAESAYEVGGVKASTTLKVKVLGPGEDGYQQYDKPTAEQFYLDGYWGRKIFYTMDSTDRGLGLVQAYNDSGEPNYLTLPRASEYSVSMYPSEAVVLNPVIKGFFGEENYRVVYSSSNDDIVSVSSDGVMTALNVRTDGDGNKIPQNTVRNATVSINLETKDENGEWKSTFYTVSINISIKKPYTNSGSYLMSYKGLGGTVEIPASLKLTVINSFAFSNYEFVDKDLEAGDVIDKEDPYNMKQWFIGDNTIEKVIIPEGVETIESYAFAGLTALREVVLPSTLYKLQLGAFYGCTSLESITFSNGNGLLFVNEKGFYNCKNITNFDFSSMIGLGKSSFEGTGLMDINLPKVESIGERAFGNCTSLNTVTMGASSVKLGNEAFAGCGRLTSININAKVIPNGTFDSCRALTNVTLGRDVEVIGQYAFRYTAVSAFVVDNANHEFEAKDSGKYLIDSEGKLALVAPAASATFSDSTITVVGKGAFSTAGDKLVSINLPNVTVVEDYAFANCSTLSSLTLGTLTSVGEGAFRGTTNLRKMPGFASEATIGNYAFAESGISDINLTGIKSIGEYAFAYTNSLTKAVIGDNTNVGAYAFYGSYKLGTVQIGNNCVLGEKAFSAIHISEYYKITGVTVDDERAEYFNLNNEKFTYNGNEIPVAIRPYVSSITSVSIGNNVEIGDRAFYYAGTILLQVETANSGTTSVGAQFTDLTLGEGTKIGNYAFFGCKNLKTVNGFDKVAYVGDYAFAGEIQGHLIFSNDILEVYKLNYAPQFESLSLNAATHVGKGAFAGNEALKSVTLNSGLEVLGISDQVVDEDEKVYYVDPLADTIDAGVFEGCKALESINLPGVLEIGEGALAGTAVTSVSLREGVKIGDRAFENAANLATVDNLARATSIGNSAFYNTSMTYADISDTAVLGDFAFGFSKVTGVTFGNNIETLGENPFVGCAISDYTRDNTNTFDIGSKGVKVIDGALYRPNTKGMEIVSFPMSKDVHSFEIASKTNRVGEQAFYGSKISIVKLAREVASIGHMAFFGCENLMLVNFTSIEAPRLEERFDYSYETEFSEFGTYKYMEEAFSKVMINFVDGTSRETGLKYVDILMWSPSATCVLYGANFVNKLTDESQKTHTLIMVRPSNGSGYESFIYKGYFDEVVLGRGAISDSAQAVIDMLNSLPGNLTDGDYDKVYEIYNLYNTLNMEDQNYLTAEGYAQTLSNAKRMVDSFRLDDPSGGDDPTNPPAQEANNTALYIVLGLVGGGIVIALIVYFVKRKSDNNGSDDSDDSTQSKTE